MLGNGHLKHPQSTFVDWKVSDWATTAGIDAYFTMEDGILTVKESGIYFVYAQVRYILCVKLSNSTLKNFRICVSGIFDKGINSNRYYNIY